MEKDTAFFAADGKGLTSTSANHIANMAKEMIREIETTLAEMTFYTTTVGLIGSDTVNMLSRGATPEETEAIIGQLHMAAKAKSLIAWLREAIKARERMLTDIRNLTLEEYARQKDIELREQPKLGKALTEDDFWASKSPAERCRYFTLETVAATLGKAIHPGGEFADARKELQEKAKKPHEVEGAGRDTLIYNYQPTVDESLVEDVYFRLQDQYRDVQSRLNAMKYECKRAVDESSVKVRSEYVKALAEWNAERRLLDAELAAYVRSEAARIGALRIVIPESLTDVYERVAGLGKE